MLRISTRGRYALRAMIDLAKHTEGGPVSRQDIADRQDISADYIAQLFRQLSSEGLVKGVKGPGGGYLLGGDAVAISAYDVIQAVDGPIALVHCLEANSSSSCGIIDDCMTYPLWKHLSDTIINILDSVTLEDLYTKTYTLQGDIACSSKTKQK